jgi:Flp pilus assembly protein TadG
MWKYLKDERGNILVFATLAMVAMIGFAALSIDVGTMLAARNQLQAAADAGALSGATGLLTNQTLATTRAIATVGRNLCIRQPISITAADVTFPQADRIQVQTHQVVTLNFAGVLGISSTNVTAVAVAELGTCPGAKGLKPWAIPDLYDEGDTHVLIKSGQIGAAGTNPGYFYPVDFPPLDAGYGAPETGAQEYLDNILHGSDQTISPNMMLQVEPGNMIGPTQQGVNELINQDPGAYWDGTEVVDAEGNPNSDSPRIVIIPMYYPDEVPDSGRNYVTVHRLGVFFLEGFSGQSLYGTFMTTISPEQSYSGGNSMLKGVRLVQ